jgi:glucose/arabinose dehydrogenase
VITTKSLRRSALGMAVATTVGAVLIVGTVGGAPSASAQQTPLVAQPVKLTKGTATLSVPRGWKVTVAASGLPRVRFLTPTPDGRILATTLLDLSDNSRGTVEILDGFDESSGRFTKVSRYLGGLRNPNSVAFFNDGTSTWLYVALTDRLVRYPWRDGDTAPSGAAQTITTLPDYGKPAKQGGWHLTRTVLPGPDGKIYLSVGSSCNACVEKETERATILRMNPDGSSREVFASGLRNAVGMAFIDGALVVTAMGADHLGNVQPAESVFRVDRPGFYGWPKCYVDARTGRQRVDAEYGTVQDCANAIAPIAWFPAHASPLGITRFGSQHRSPLLRSATLVALHGSSNTALRTGYSVVKLGSGGRSETVIGGFLPSSGKALARPCGIMEFGADRFLLTDDKGGHVLLVRASTGL